MTSTDPGSPDPPRAALNQWRVDELDDAIAEVEHRIRSGRSHRADVHGMAALEAERKRLYGEFTRRGL